MTIDEAIEKLKYDFEIDMYIHDIAPQLVWWLEELNSYRAHIFSGDMTQAMLKEQYCKAVDDCIKEVEEEEKQHNHIITKDCLFWLKRKFEQLKGDANNGTDSQ